MRPPQTILFCSWLAHGRLKYELDWMGGGETGQGLGNMAAMRVESPKRTL